MIVAYQSSEAFANICMVSIYSLLSCQTANKDLDIYILSPDISEKSISCIRKMMSELGFDGRRLSVIDISNIRQRFDLMFDDYNGKWGIDSFCKLMLGSLLPKSVEKVLYLDSDTIICKPLDELFATDIQGFLLAASKDFMSKEYFEFFQLDHSDIYCNSGMMLFNLTRWREEKVEKQIRDYLKSQNGQVFFSEQSVMNIICRKKMKCLPLAYNFTTVPAALSYSQIKSLRKPQNSYTEAEVIAAKKEPIIIHYTTLFMINGRVWHENNKHPYKEAFEKNAQNVPFFKQLKLKQSFLNRVLKVLIDSVPRNILCKLVGIYYNSCRLSRYKNYIRRKNKLQNSVS